MSSVIFKSPCKYIWVVSENPGTSRIKLLCLWLRKKLAFLCNYLSFIFFCFSGKPCPAFKLVILDEADSMTPSAQVRISLH